MSRRLAVATALAVLTVTGSWAGTAQRAHASTVHTTGIKSGTQRVITRDGSPYVVQGFLYDPVFIGDQWLGQSWAQDEATCKMDADLMKGAGVNTVRILYEPVAPAAASLYTACLDDLANDGIGVLWLIQAPNGTEEGIADVSGGGVVQDTNAWETAYEQWIQTALDSFANHPATLFWTIGNEYPLACNDNTHCWLGSAASGRVGILDRLVQYVHARDPNHLVGTSMTSGAWQLTDSNVPHLDFWGINSYLETYTGTDSTGNYFTDLSSVDSRPKIITEFGADRYWCTPGALTVINVAYSCETTSAPVSGESQTAQRDRIAAQWTNIAANVATPASPNGALSGGLVFGLSDNWSYSVATFTPSSTATHDTVGKESYYDFLGTPEYAATEPDNYENAEWWGVATAMWHGQNFPRATTLAFDSLAAKWSSTAPPTMSGLTVTMSGCIPTISWTTSEATTTEVQDGQEAVVLDGTDMVQDNTIYLLAWNDTTHYTTSHTATLTAQPLPGRWLRLVPRSFTSDGRSVTAAPIRVTC